MKRLVFLMTLIGFFSIGKMVAFECCEVCPDYDWTGMYMGINGGYGWGHVDYEFSPGGSGDSPDINLFAPDTGDGFDKNLDGGILGGHLGFNVQWCKCIFGLEGAFEGSWLNREVSNVFAPIVVPNVTYETTVNWFATVTPRLGYAHNNWLIYSKGGLVAARITSKLYHGGPGGGVVPTAREENFKQREDHIGWTVGAGIEYAWYCNWIFGVEYDYYRLPQGRYGGEVNPNTAFPVDYRLRPTFNSILLRLSYKFW